MPSAKLSGAPNPESAMGLDVGQVAIGAVAVLGAALLLVGAYRFRVWAKGRENES